MYRTMVRIRRFEETAQELFEAGTVVGGIHVSAGQEACSVGVCTALRQEDAILTTHRGHGHSIAKGTRLPEMMAELFGKATGLCHAKGGSMHIADVSKGHYGAHSIVGSNMPMAAGIGLAFQFEGKGQVAVSFFGDGASNQGAFHESMNLCAIWKLPVIYFCENNQFASSTRVGYSTSVEDISMRAQGYGAPGVTVDGMDVLAVYEAASEAVRRAREGGGPTLIEAKTYRYYGHSRSQEKFGSYRSEAEWAEWQERDPIRVAENILGITAEEKKAHAEAVEAEIAEAISYAERSPEPAPEAAYEDLYA
ncbi:thiamine pyrophosphate-dependent dehydrogenase E1 component subunit alpha [Nitrospinota bacterium]